VPVEPPPSPWRFPDVEVADAQGVVGLGADLEPGTLLQAYRSGVFPMQLHDHGPMAWWSPDPRGVIPLDALVVSRSLRRARRRYDVRVDTAFSEVVAACADPRRPGGWISQEISAAYGVLHELGWAHSVEVWDEHGLAGGLYGVAIGGLFAGESMFHRRRDASKVALLGLVALLRPEEPDRLLDVQWATEHLRSLGAIEVPRQRYLTMLDAALSLTLPPAFA
jgi:leucyl/phenylalanyl-tRNA---protein transferase